MKKIIAGGIFTFAIAASVFSFSKPASASCGAVFEIGAESEVINGCAESTENHQIEGFSIDVENNKITLNNYHGGGIYYFCRATCAGVKAMDIELIGENTITSESSSQFSNEATTPKNAAFINIIPTFTGSGTIKIQAGQPIAFETQNTDSFSVNVVGADFKGATVESATKEEENTKEDLEDSTIYVAAPAVTASDNNNKVASFFGTTLGMVLLIAVPSILLIIIIILVIILSKKKNSPEPKDNEANPTVYNQQQ